MLTLIKKNLDDRQFTSWMKEVDERVNGTVKKERRRREERNGHNGHTGHWGRGQGQVQVLMIEVSNSKGVYLLKIFWPPL